MSEIPQTDVSRPSALPTAKLSRGNAAQSSIDQSSAEYLDTIEEEWNKRVDMEVETLVDGMVDLVSLASVNTFSLHVSTQQLITLRRLAIRINFALHKNRSRRNHAQSPW